MGKNSIQGFVEMASGLGEMTKSRATEAATELLTLTTKAPGASKHLARQASTLAEGLLEAAETNRQQLVSLVRGEIDSAVSKLDIGTITHDIANLTASVQAIVAQLDDLRSGRGAEAHSPTPPSATAESKPAVPKPAVPARTGTKKAATAKRAAAAEPAAASAGDALARPAKKAPAKRAPASKKTAAKKTAAKKAPAQGASAKRTVAAKASPAPRTASGAADTAPDETPAT